MSARIATTVVGSYPQPGWLVDRTKFETAVVPRVRMPEVWRVAPDLLAAAQDDAVRLAVGDMERAGVDVVTDGEQRRESYFNQFANALDGVDLARPGTALNRLGRPTPVPRIVGPIRRARPVCLADVRFLRAVTDRPIKVTVPGPFTLAQLAEDEHYRDESRLAMAYAEAVNAELRELEPHVDVIQLDEPYLQARPDRARAYAIPAIDRALAGLAGPTCVHLCFGYAYAHARAGTTKPSGYSFLPELARCAARQVSIEAAAPRPGGARRAPGEDDRPRRPRSRRSNARDARGRRPPARGGAPPRARGAAGRRAGLRDEIPRARAGAREAPRPGRRRPARRRRAVAVPAVYSGRPS